MSGCCDNGCSLDRLRERQRGTLLIVLGINAVMFFVIAAAAFYGKSTALLADSRDNLVDALTYGLSLYSVSRGRAVMATVALFKKSYSLLLSPWPLKLFTGFCPQRPRLRDYGHIQPSGSCCKFHLFFFCGATVTKT